MLKYPEQYRVAGEKNYPGVFEIPLINEPLKCIVIASDRMKWEHVSASLANRPPTWNEMCLIKYLFWDDNDCVIQYHPPHKDYVNVFTNCLHLWRPLDLEIPMPPKILI